MDAYIVVIAEIVAGEPYAREQHTVFLPSSGTAAAALQWLQTDVWPRLQEQFPGRTVDDWKVFYTPMLELPLS